jgi:hypothetical protein
MLKTAAKIKEAEDALRSEGEALREKKKLLSKEEKASAALAVKVEEIRASMVKEHTAALNAAIAEASSSKQPLPTIYGAHFDLKSAVNNAFVVKSASEVAIEQYFDANVLPVLAYTKNENMRQENENAHQESLIAGKTGTQAEQKQAVNDAYKEAFPLSPEQRMAGFKEKIAGLTEPQQKIALESVKPFAEKYNLDLSLDFKLQESPQL